MQGYHYKEDPKEVKEQQVQGLSKGRGNSSFAVLKARACLACLRNGEGSCVKWGKRRRVVDVGKGKGRLGRMADYIVRNTDHCKYLILTY